MEKLTTCLNYIGRIEELNRIDRIEYIVEISRHKVITGHLKICGNENTNQIASRVASTPLMWSAPFSLVGREKKDE